MVLDLPWPIGVADAALVLLVVGMLIERTLIETLRRRAGRDWQLDAFVLTIGMLVIMQNLALIFFGTERRGVSDLIEGTFVLGPLLVYYERLMIVGVAAAAGLELWAFIRFNSLGKAIRAASQDPHAEQPLGIDIQQNGRNHA